MIYLHNPGNMTKKSIRFIQPPMIRLMPASQALRYVQRFSTRVLSVPPCSNEVPPNILTRSVEEESKGLSSMDHLLRAVSKSGQILFSKRTFMNPRETR